MKANATILLVLGGFVPVASFGPNYSNNIHLDRCKQLRNGRSEIDIKKANAADALVLLDQAKALREEASSLQKQLQVEKEERIRKEMAKIDSLIDQLLFHGSTNYHCDDQTSTSTVMQSTEERSNTQLMNTEEQVAELLISKRLNYDQVNQMFDRICELANRPQSVDSCSPLLSLLLDAACKVDCLEREENPNKRWNHRVERNLRQKLFALGYGIRIDDVKRENEVRSITGEKDVY